MDVNKQINIPYLLKIGFGKTPKIGKYLIDKGFESIAIFYGVGMEDMFGKEIAKSLKKHKVKTIKKATIDTIAIEDITKMAFSLPANVNAIVGVGGGKVLDFAKYLAYLLRIPYIAMPTSMSNDGFCSPSSSLTVAGRRKTVKSSIPYGVVIDLDIIKKNPLVFLYSGIGDMVSKLSALKDWKEAVKRNNAKNNDFARMMTYNSLDLLFLKNPYKINSDEFIRPLVMSLLTSGVAMEMAGSSRPASGSEHLISHALDNIAKKPQMHGIQVGVATILCALLQNNKHIVALKNLLVKVGFVDFVSKNPLDKEDFIEAIKMAPEIKNDFWTVLSEKGAIKKAIKLIETDNLLRKMIVWSKRRE